MSAPDTTMPVGSAPWLDADRNALPAKDLPGLRSEVIQNLECSYPGILSHTMKALRRPPHEPAQIDVVELRPCA